MDEPLGTLDTELRDHMVRELRELHNRIKATTVYVTHDQIEAMAMADAIAVMNQGLIEQLGTPQEIYDRPASMFVADFIGSPSMNFLYFRASLQKGVGEVQVNGATIAVP
jgi:multiple sugar transport system ATP-binding protein